METSTSLGVLQGSTAPVLTQSKLHHMWKRGFWDYGGKKLDYGGRRALISETLPFVAIIAAHVVCKFDFFFWKPYNFILIYVMYYRDFFSFFQYNPKMLLNHTLCNVAFSNSFSFLFFFK